MGCSNSPIEIINEPHLIPSLPIPNSIENNIQKNLDNKSSNSNIYKINFKKDKDEIEELEKSDKNIESKINFKDLFLCGLSPEYIKIFKENSKLFYCQSFLEGICNEYGIMGTKQDKNRAFNIYKKGADSKNDYLCMYRLHKIYLNDNEDFEVEKDSTLEKLYLYKCFAYLPFKLINGNHFIFNKINITYEIAYYLDIKDSDFSEFDNIMKKLEENINNYNININDIKLMKLVFKTYFNSSKYSLDIRNLNPFLNLEKESNAYYEGKLKYCNFCLEYFPDKCDKEKIRKIFNDLINSRYYKAAFDYGNFLIGEGNFDEDKNIIKIGLDNSCQFCLSQYPFLLLREKEMEQILNDGVFTQELLKYMVLSSCLEKFNFSSIFYLVYYLTKHSPNKNNLEKNYFNLTKEIYNNFEKEAQNIDNLEKYVEERYLIEIPFLFGQMCYYGIQNHIKSDKVKALTYFKKSYKLSCEKYYIYFQKINYVYIYKCRKYLLKTKSITEEKFKKTKDKLIKIFINSELKNLSTFELYQNYKLYKSSNVPISKAKIVNLLNRANKIKMVYYFKDFVYKEKSKKLLKEYEKLCPICYEKEKSVTLDICQHLVCQTCFDKIKNDLCPICGKEFHNNM